MFLLFNRTKYKENFNIHVRIKRHITSCDVHFMSMSQDPQLYSQPDRQRQVELPGFTYLPVFASRRSWVCKGCEIQAYCGIRPRADRGGAGVGHHIVSRLDAHLIKTPVEQRTNCFCSMEWLPDALVCNGDVKYQCKRLKVGYIRLNLVFSVLSWQIIFKWLFITIKRRNKILLCESHVTSKEHVHVTFQPKNKAGKKRNYRKIIL